MSIRLIKHFFAIAGGQILNFVSTLLLLPLFLRHWSAFMYGEWLVLSGLTAYLTTLDLGMNAAVSNRMLSAHTRKDSAEYMRCQHSATAFYLCIAIGASLLTGLIAWLLPISAWVGVKSSAVPDAPWILWLLALQVVWGMPVGLLGNFYLTIGDPAKTKWINNGRAFGTIIVTVVGLLLGCKMRTLAILQLIPFGVVAVCILWDMRRRYPQFLPGLAEAKVGVMRELIKPSLMFALIMVAMSLSQQGSVLVVSTFFGAVAVATFYTARTLTNLAMQLVRMVAFSAEPVMTMLYAQGDLARLRLLNRLVVTLSMTLCISIVSALWFEGTSVIALWSHHRIHVDVLFFRLLLLYLVLQSPWLANAIVTAAINKHHNQSRSYLASSILALISMIALAPHLGLLAVPIGLIFGEAIACYHFVIKDTCSVIGEPYGPYALRIWGGLLVVSFAAFAAGWGIHQMEVGPAILCWVEVGLVTTAASSVSAYFVWTGGNEREFLHQKWELGRLRLKGSHVNQPA